MAAKKTKADDRTAAQKSMDQHREEMAKPAEVPAATEFSTSGAPVQIVSDVDPEHPAVDNDPRANTTVAQNRIDFNDPGLEPAKAVEENLRKQAAE
ncbi:hypothetical protein [uncultured Enterovirga sp.]|uniref:hypothetical protein n=1 Tax=uncultured Enterovirga sp. TaxID=2026352 RepID=UPI0035CC309F